MFVFLFGQESDIRLDTRQQTRIELSTKFGRVIFKSPRKDSEKLVPLVLDAIRQSSKFLAKYGVNIPQKDLSITLMEGSVDHLDLPEWLKKSCHPGWVQGGDKVIIIKRRVHDCVPGDFDSSFQRVLIHELGHVTLFRLREDFWVDQEVHEGFATWFEYQVLGLTPVLTDKICSSKNINFDLSPDGYLRAALIFFAFTPSDVLKVISTAQINELKAAYRKGLSKFCN